MPADVDLTRAMNSLSATLNDQKPEAFDAERVQEIVNGATAGEMKLVAYGSGTSGELRDGSIDGPAVAKVSLEDGKWSVERVPQARKSEALEQKEQSRTQQTETEYQKPIRGRIAIWKKTLLG